MGDTELADVVTVSGCGTAFAIIILCAFVFLALALLAGSAQ